MDASETELVRKVLAAVLKRLEGGGLIPVAEDVSVATDGSPARPRSETGENNLMLLVLGPSVSSSASESLETTRGGATHPVFQRFAVTQHCSPDSAPKPCFLEPDKVCVNSGACETRGY